MKKWTRLIATAAVAVATASASAETCKLELKRIRASGTSSGMDDMHLSSSPQYFLLHINRDRLDQENYGFSEVIKTEPEKYHGKHQLKAVAKLGAQQFGFVLDAKDAASKGYVRLLFDLNHNGDLTDDKPVEDSSKRTDSENSSLYEYPNIDVTIDAGGTKLDATFRLSVSSKTAFGYTCVKASLSAGAYRIGQITLDGKVRQIALLDFNSNGRFDDEFKIRQDVTVDGQALAECGDVLLIDAGPTASPSRTPDDVATSDDQHCVGKQVCIDGRLYDMRVSAAGDELTLTRYLEEGEFPK